MPAERLRALQQHAAWWRLFVAALSLRVLFIALMPGPAHYADLDHGDPLYFGMIADHLAHGDGFLEERARAYRPPVFPASMGVSFALFGDYTLPIQLFLAFCGALHCLFTVLWCRRLVDERAAWMAGWLAAFYPQFVRYPQTLYSEPLFLMLLALAMWLLLDAAQHGSRRLALGAGLVCGVAVLTREVALVLPIGYLLWAALHQPRLPRWGSCWAVYCVGCGLAILPWTIRNEVVLHAFVPITTNAGINIYMGNNPHAAADWNGWYVAPGVEWQDGAGEVAADEQGKAEAFRYIRTHPARTAELSIQKLWHFWRPPYYGFRGASPAEQGFRLAWLIAYLGLLGLTARGASQLRSRWRELALPVWAVLGFSAATMLTHADARFRLPAVAMLLVFAGPGCLTGRMADAERGGAVRSDPT